MSGVIGRALSRFVEWNKALSLAVDARLGGKYATDGHGDFRHAFAPGFLRPGARIVDVGGGKVPYIDPKRKQDLGLTVVGLDIDRGELERAPAGAYDRVICSDIQEYRGDGDADLIVCQAVLEHVPDVGRGLAALASILKPGGTALVFVPCRNAVFARLNLLVPDGLKRRVLFALFPDHRYGGGFRSYYDRCTPGQFRALAAGLGLEVVAERHYYRSGYFMVFFPLFVAWRAWVLLFHAVAGDRASESFSMALRKIEVPADARGAEAGRHPGAPDALPDAAPAVAP